MTSSFMNLNSIVQNNRNQLFDILKGITIFMGALSTEFKIYNYSDIVSYRPIERGHDEKKKHGITRAVVGGVLAGGAGAVVGAVTGGKHNEILDQLAVVINFSDGSNESVIFVNTETKGMLAKQAYDYMDALIGQLESIIASNSTLNTEQKPKITEPTSSDLKSKLNELKDLVDQNLITEEEYSEKKRQLLGL